MINELKLDLLKASKKSILRIVLGILFFLVACGGIITKIIGEGIKPFDVFFFGIFALCGIIHFIEGLGFSFESLFGKAYILVNDEFISLKASIFDKKQLINWNEIQSIDYKLNKFIIQKTDNTTPIIDLSKFEYIINMEIKNVIISIAKEKKIQSNF